MPAVIRRATPNDFDAIFTIWMQDDVNPFMSFEQYKEEDKEKFRPLFQQIMDGSEVYVLVDEKNNVVATRRMSFGSGEQAHTVEFASFGVHKDHRRHGYGTQFYNEFIKIIEAKNIENAKENKPAISRIAISQETDNPPAFALATKMGFKKEAVYPDWLPRMTGLEKFTKKWLIGESFLAWVDPEITKNAKKIGYFIPKLPSLKKLDNANKNIEIKQEGNTFSCYSNGQLQVTCEKNSGVRRFDQIQFWSLKVEKDADKTAVENSIRQLVSESAKTHKKIELAASDQTTLDILADLGFHYRGETKASKMVDNTYYNEAGVDFSFYNIADAKKMLDTLKIKDLANFNKVKIKSKLTSCLIEIDAAFKKNEIDHYGCFYLENLAFQMTREGLGEVRLYNAETAPWSGIIESLPQSLKLSFTDLAENIQILNPGFMKIDANQNDLSEAPKIVK